MAGLATRQMAVRAALAGGECLTTAELAARTGLDRTDVTDATGRMVLAGLVDRRERGCFILSPAGRDQLCRGEDITSGPRGPIGVVDRRPVRRTQQDKLWKAIRLVGKFTLDRICELAEAKTASARRYVLRLVRAGYLVEIKREAGTAPTSPGFKRWSLIIDPGPLAPMVKADGRVWDPNARRFAGEDGAR